MAGIYIHIPFCKQACHYCDFHFSTSLGQAPAMVEAIIKELQLQKSYLAGKTVNTLYLGGGTPSLLSPAVLGQILDAVTLTYLLAADAEITLEANPDDLTPERLAALKALPINRLSIGLQSFYEPHLRLMNRVHTAQEAAQCVQLAQQAGFDNISIDLIYGIPAPDHSIWQLDLETAFALGVQHISAYALTIEPNTALGRWSVSGRFTPGTDDFVAEQFELLLAGMQQHGFEQYEISNFCKPGYYSRHNSNYWLGVPYLGIGPSAHSFSGSSRQHNVAHNTQYITSLNEGKVPMVPDELSPEDQVNEYILTSLRTKWGCNLAWLKKEKNTDLVQLHEQYIHTLLVQNLALLQSDTLYLTDAGKLLADKIASDLFI